MPAVKTTRHLHVNTAQLQHEEFIFSFLYGFAISVNIVIVNQNACYDYVL